MNLITKIISITMMTLMVFMACENADTTMGPDNRQSPEMLAKAKGGKGGNGGNGGSAGCPGVGEPAGNTDYGIYEYTLWAGKHNDAGTVSITNDDENIYVTYNTNETAELGEVHVYVWTGEGQLPSRRPAPGQANYVVENIDADSYTVVIPADISCDNTYYISTHAALVGSGDNAGETAYGGDDFSPDCFDATKGAWWGYVTYAVECFDDDICSGSLLTNGSFEDGMNGWTTNGLPNYDRGNFGQPSGNWSLDMLGTPGVGLISQTISTVPGAVYEVSFAIAPNNHPYDGNTFEEIVVGFGGSSATLRLYKGDVWQYVSREFTATSTSTSLSFTGVAVGGDLSSGMFLDDVCVVELYPPDCDYCLVVVNGSFEDGSLGNPPLPGWTHSGVSGYGGNSIDWGNWAGAASDGDWTIDLVGTGTPAQGMQAGSVEQTLCTVTGEEYVLTFDLMTNGSASLLVTIDGSSQTFGSVGGWTSKTMTFTAISSATTIRLAADASWHYLYNNVFLDKVSVACSN